MDEKTGNARLDAVRQLVLLELQTVRKHLLVALLSRLIAEELGVVTAVLTTNAPVFDVAAFRVAHHHAGQTAF